uniref:Uncharacterized protein n=1 Tax=Chaetoceros debilis TaxID=122233 RepID=A0A6S8V7W3_9STRA|mmetsp:Transcript_13952/g.20279  ORF Transcript_13952/g.20279 Transcript_13952/m.20279 type:complete len:730 (+) Transcript_13952:327-2516(+)|eukprot:CAMPEP_0194077006 /NCGR_PEP_ID=MMETSP0149-20130528/3703_1 /TAXON_ID=122233 /ORGANISM="Chaetoceros debilis, Strain MM31A-1" /LENGTH=729 /DNA_ID=CAMNT_0038757897 /DNA_START=291 /DNA_END=2480 /DNA_ORIENTATION=-
MVAKHEAPMNFWETFSSIFTPKDSNNNSNNNNNNNSSNAIHNNASPYKRLLCTGTDADIALEKRNQTRRSKRQDYAKSKSGVWGPTHSSDEEDEKSVTEEESMSTSGGGGGGIGMLSPQTPVASSPHTPHGAGAGANNKKNNANTNANPNGNNASPQMAPKRIFEGMLNCASEVWNDYVNPTDGGMCKPCNTCKGDLEMTVDQKYGSKIDINGDAEAHLKKTPASNLVDGYGGKGKGKTSASASNANGVPLTKHQSHTSSLSSGIARRTLGYTTSTKGTTTTPTTTSTKGGAATSTVKSSICDDENARAAAKAMGVKHKAAAKSSSSDQLIPDMWAPPPAPPMSPGMGMSPQMHMQMQGQVIGMGQGQAQPAITPNSRRDRKRDPPPFNHINLDLKNDFSRSISELTMRSSLGEVSEKISDSRRMAYYAVGKNHGNSSSNNASGNDNSGNGNGKQNSSNGGGNRRCYFTGDLIRGGQPFYAGSVQQGLRTLVVFCLPNALGLPHREELERLNSIVASESEHCDRDREDLEAMEMKSSLSNISRKSTKSAKSGKSALSRISSIWSDGAAMESYHTEWTEDEHGNLCELIKPEWLLQALPEPNPELMTEMKMRFPDQFATLPKQVRGHQCWRLYMKFCFFSGLPIADGEMYYKVSDKISSKMSRKLYKAGIDEIILSHEVMEAVNGQSAEILRLPNKKTFRYLQKHYTQQCAKLSNRVFDRTSWEMVMPEV